MCSYIGNGVVLLVYLFMRFIVHSVELSLINWLYCDGVGASVISSAKNRWLFGHC
jgi:hypothetical protein